MTGKDLRVPAEWEPHSACWIAWPYHDDWGSELTVARDEWIGFARALAAAGETLRILVPDDRTDLGCTWAGATTHAVPYGDIWVRDTGPVFALDSTGQRRAVCFRFNGWGNRYLYAGDPGLAPQLAALESSPTESFEVVLEGGAVETDGCGTALTTRACLLHPERNPNRTEADLTEVVRTAYGVEVVVWLSRGLANDHTDGHVDTLARFVRPGVIAFMEPSPNDPNRDVLDEVRDTLENTRVRSGDRPTLVPLPSPGAVTDRRGALLPASYLNFFIANRSVLVPLFGKRSDERAIRRLEECFPDRNVHGLPARALLTGGGAFHCITQQVPAEALDV